jgi:hypothetical protein
MPPMILPALPLTILPKKVATALKLMRPCIVPVFVIPEDANIGYTNAPF